MNTITLKMRYGPHPARETVAWCIACGHPAAWLREIGAWDVPHRWLRLLPLPRSASDRRSLGVLITLSDKATPKVSGRCVPFGRAAERLFIPVEARFDPNVSDEELRTMLPGSHTYVWHPVCGVVAFEPGDVLSVADLLSAGPPKKGRWDHADPGVTFSRRLTAISPEQQLTIEAFMKEGRDDIGSESDIMGKLPSSPLEPKRDPISAASRGGRRILAGIVHWLAKRAPATSGVPTRVNYLEQWAERQLAALRAGLDASRNREIARLMHLLKTDPDRGLRFALPLGGDAHRGLGAAGGRLREQNVDFNLARLGGGHAADIWNVSANYRLQLMARYRELANREVRLGRHRRAAYIFAELLADLHAAANVLVAGRHWREAAVLYRKRLNRPLDAARCLEQGGLWIEAIELHVELGQHEKAGDLFSQLGQPVEARREYRKAIDKHQEDGDPMSAARLLDEKLQVPDEAIDVLSHAWPGSPQAETCLRQVFRILARLGRHDATMAWVDRLDNQPSPAGRELSVVDVLADTAIGYPDERVKQRAADGARSVVSRQLSNAFSPERRQLLSAVARLVPEDRLLSRDCQRYLQQSTPVPKPRPTSRTRTVPRRTPKLVRTIQLPQNVCWLAATASGKTIYAAGVSDGSLLLVRSTWQQLDLPGKAWSIDISAELPSILLCAAPQHERHVLVHLIGRRPLDKLHTFQPTDRCPEQVEAGRIEGLTSGVLAAARTFHAITWLVESRGGQLTLVSTGPNGETISTEIVPLPRPPEEYDKTPPILPLPMHARSEKVYLGIMDRMVIFDRAKPPEVVEFGQAIKSLTGSLPNTRTRVAVTFATGGELHWDDFKGRHHEAFANDMPDPVVCINRGGYLVAASEDVCEVYTTHERRVHLDATAELPHARPIAVLSGPRTDQFGIVLREGVIRVYEFP